MSFSGADTGQLRALAREGDQMLGVIAEAKQMLTSLANELPSIWIGNDATQFLSDLSSVHVPAIVKAETRLSEAVAALRRNADLQDQASSRLD